MGSYKWGYKSPNMGYNLVMTIATLLITQLITAHEPPSSRSLAALGAPEWENCFCLYCLGSWPFQPAESELCPDHLPRDSNIP